RLGEAEQEREITVNPLALKALGGPHALPGAGDLDEDALAAEPGLLVQPDQPSSLGQRSLGVEAQSRIDLSRNPAGDDSEDFTAEADQQAVHERLGAGRAVAGGLQGVLDGFLQEV